MGFGYVVIGYMLTVVLLPTLNMSIDIFSFMPFAGSIIMLYGFNKLKQYNKYFAYTRIACIALTVFSVFVLFFEMLKIIPSYLPDYKELYGIVHYSVRCTILLLFHIMFYAAVHVIAVEIGNKQICYQVKRNLVVTALYILSILLSNLALHTNFVDPQIIIKISFVVGIVWFFFNLTMIYTCFGRISYESAEEEAALLEQSNKNKKKKKK